METGVLQGSRGAYRLAAHPGSISVPATVQAILAARIDRLATEDKRLLQAAAVIGKDAPYPLLREIAELPDEQLHHGLAALQASEFLYETSLFPDLEYTFRHALTHEVTYGGVLQERRRVLHARIVQAIEVLYADRLAEQIERLAQHAFRGEAWSKAHDYLRQAGERAYGRSANRAAVVAFEQALAALARLPETPETLERTIDLLLLLRAPLLQLGEFGPMLEHTRQAEVLLKKLNDPLRMGWSAAHMCQGCYLVGELAEAIEHGERALALATELGAKELEAATNYYLGAGVRIPR